MKSTLSKKIDLKNNTLKIWNKFKSKKLLKIWFNRQNSYKLKTY